MKKKIAVIVPPVVTHNLDPHTGIPFLPHMAAYLAAKIDQLGHDVVVIDCLGENSKKINVSGEFMTIGLNENDVADLVDDNIDLCMIYCKVIEDLYALEKILKRLKKKNSKIKICLFENIQTTNSFSLKKINKYLFNKGADFILLSEPEHKIEILINALDDNNLVKKVPGLLYLDKKHIQENPEINFNSELDNLPFPLWEKFNMNGYWNLGFAHPPIKKNKKFLPILSSRGCPFRCHFCVSPSLNPSWRSRSAKNVVDEIEYFYKKMNIEDFHFSDLDPTVNEKRIIEISNEIINRKIKIEWKLAQGTKIETIKNLSSLDLMKKSGLSFLSFSPESGSIELMKKLNKPFDYNHAISITKHANKINLKTQACFITGTPPERDIDRALTLNFMKKLVKSGIDEIAVFIYSPIPGSFFADKIKGFKHYSQLTRSPTWREDYKLIRSFRYKMYTYFFIFKLIYFPKKCLKEIYRIITMNFETKMEMSIFKYLKLRYLKYRNILASANN